MSAQKVPSQNLFPADPDLRHMTYKVMWHAVFYGLVPLCLPPVSENFLPDSSLNNFGSSSFHPPCFAHNIPSA